MAFIRKRISPSQRQTPSYQIIETYRSNGKVRQRVLANLGSSSMPERALEQFRREMVNTRNLIEDFQLNCPDELASPSGRRRLDRWRRCLARQRETVRRLETFLASGRRYTAPESSVPTRAQNGTNFLDWVIERNSTGWL